MRDRLIWERDGLNWPNRAASRFVTAAGLKWHVQLSGSGPAVLLLHGTGASTHSFAGLSPLLAERFTVIAPDLPGHAFTDLPGRSQLSLPGMASSIASLLQELGIKPVLCAGHSAGAAILIRMTLDRSIAPGAIVSINGALLPFQGIAGQLFSPLAKLIALNRIVPRLVAWRAGSRHAVENLLLGTGSVTPKPYIDLYEKLFTSPQHVAGTLGMMACWDLAAFARDLPRLEAPLKLVAAQNDRTIAPQDCDRTAKLVRAATTVKIPALGHLCHEECPELIAGLIADASIRSS